LFLKEVGGCGKLQARKGLARAIFLTLWAAAARRHWQATASQTSEASLAMAVELLGVGKRSFQGLLAALVDALAHGVSRWASVRSRASVQTWRMIRRVALRFDVHEASSEQVLQIAGA
jgi:hypothetical protein